jgi:hypothetical protein
LTFHYSTDWGELTRVVESKCFGAEDSSLRADVLKDCLAELRAMYDDAVRDFQEDVQEAMDAKEAQLGPRHDVSSVSAQDDVLARCVVGIAPATSCSTPPPELCPDLEI